MRKLSSLIAVALVLSFGLMPAAMPAPVLAASIQSVAVPLNTTNFPALIGAPNMQQVGFGNGKASGNQMSTWESICVIDECFDLTAVDADPLWVKTGVGSICTVSDIIDGPLEVTRTTWDVGSSNNWLIEVVVSSLLPGIADEAGARIWVKARMDEDTESQYRNISVRLMKEASNDDNFIGLYNQNGNLAQTAGGSDAKIVLRWDQHLPRYRISLMRQGDEIIMTAEPSVVADLAVNGESPWTSQAFAFIDVLPGEDLAPFSVKFENVGTDAGALTFSMSYEESDMAGAPAPNMDADEFASLVYVAKVTHQYFGGSYPEGGSIHENELDNWLGMDAFYGNNDGILSLYEMMLASPIDWATAEGDTLPAGEASEFVITFELGDSLDSQGDGISVTVSATLGTDTEQSSGNVFQAFGVVGPVLNVDTDVSYGAIQAAIDDANPDDTISVADGYYDLTAPIVVDESVVLTGDVTTPSNIVVNAGTITGDDRDCFQVKADNVTIQGFKMQGAQDASGEQNCGVVIGTHWGESESIAGLHHISISYNEFLDCSKGVFMWQVKDSTVSYNKFTTTEGQTSDNFTDTKGWGGDAVHVYLSVASDYPTGNTISHNIMDNVRVGVFLNGDTISGTVPSAWDFSGTTIEDNTMTDVWNAGIVLQCASGTAESKIKIKGNNINTSTGRRAGDEGNERGLLSVHGDYTVITSNILTNSEEHGMWVDGSHHTVTGNTVASNTKDGIHAGWYKEVEPNHGWTLPGITRADITIQYNNISGNTGDGLDAVQADAEVDATKNWWGDATGPKNPTLNSDGLGNVVSDNVSFDPWLLQEYPTLPSLVTSAATPVTTSQATLSGSLDNLGSSLSVEVSFEWGTTTAYGTETTTQSMEATGAFSFDLPGLTPATTYYFRAKAVGDGTSYGDESSFITTALPTPAPAPADGGGGGAPPSYSTKTDLFGTDKTIYTNYKGKLKRTVEATSEDGLLTMTIPKDTIALDKGGKRLKTVEVAVNESPPDPPEDVCVIGLAYSFGPNGATFNPPMTLTWSYDPDALPEGVAEEDLVLAFYDEDAGEWVELDGVVDTENNTVTASVAHFTTIAIIGTVVVPEPAPAPAPAPAPPAPVVPPPVITQPKPAPPAPVVSPPVITQPLPAAPEAPAPAPEAPVVTPPAVPPVEPEAPPWDLIIGLIAATILVGIAIWLIRKRKSSV